MCVPLTTPSSIGKAATRRRLHCDATKFGCTCPSGGQCGGSPLFGDQTSSFSVWPVSRAGVVGGLVAGFWLVGFLPTGYRSLVRGIWLVLLQAGDVESNPGPDRGPCVGCGLTPAENARALLWYREGCGRECHYREACYGLRRGEQHQGNWAWCGG
jgi:hypothetical protein